MSWTHLIRFNHKGSPTFAQLVDPKESGELDDKIEAKIATGNPVKRNIELTGETVTVDKKDLLPPAADVPIVVQTGLNYHDHVKEATEIGYQVRCFLVSLELKDLLLLIDVCACRIFHRPAHISSGAHQPVSLVHTRKSTYIRFSKTRSTMRAS
jgi:hypothetical protein